MQGVRRWEIASFEVQGEPVHIESLRQLGPIAEQSARARSEDQLAFVKRVVKRLDAKPIPRKEQLFLLPIPDAEREHAAQPAEEVAPPARVGRQDDFGIRVALPVATQLGTQL